MMLQIFRTQFGSHLYGTSTPASDFDFKSVFVPEARAILLQRVKGAFNDKRPKAEFEKNVAGEVEEERFAVQKFLSLLAEGQTVALDMLFAPEWAWIGEPAWQWNEIVANRHRLITKRSQAFIGYTYKQASKYGVKGSRVAAGRLALAWVDDAISQGYSPNAKLAEWAVGHEASIEAIEHMSIEDQTMPNGTIIRHWQVCGRKMPYSSSIKNAREILQRMVDEYGHRALQAERNEGVDWKALSHAVRVGTQAIELLQTGHVTFPLPNAAHVLEIKTGGRSYASVAEEIEDLLELVKAAAEKSVLRECPDQVWIDDFVLECHRRQVMAA
jgi:hypothetical protein